MKKIISICILNLLLITCISSITVSGSETIKASDSQASYELILTVENLRPHVIKIPFEPPKFFGYLADVYIKNIGTKNLLKSEYPELETIQIAEFDGEVVYSHIINWWDHPFIGNSLDQGEKIGYTFRWDADLVPVSSLLKIQLDPENLIPEWDEDNYWEAIGPDVKSRSRLVNSFFIRLLDQFPLFQRLLNL